ncbi:MAG: ATP-binding protein [Desulfuromonadales bacterium]|nr:ATP-binding protein [Desulfuromonadales bacterium]
MAKVHVVAKRDHLQSLTTARPLAAVAELVWNGFDAGADRVQVFLDMNDIGGLQKIFVRDHGSGIPHNEIESLFGSLGESWKKRKARQNGRALHGKNGKGRFRAFALGNRVEWNTTYRENGATYSYRIIGNADTIDDFDASDPVEVKGVPVGTEVTVYNLARNFRSLVDDTAPMELAKIFAAYLTEYPDLNLEYNGLSVDPIIAQRHSAEYPLGEIDISGGKRTAVSVTIIEWKISTERVVHLCDANGIALHELPVGQQIRAPGFHFTVYVKSNHFRELDNSNELALAEIHPDVQVILNAAKVRVKEHFRRRALEDQGEIVDRWKKEHIYPYADKPFIDPVEAAERQVFDILAVNVQSYLPSFEGADIKSRKFTFRLLAQAIRENPDSVQEIIGEVLGLKKEAQDDLADLLKKTPLSSIISSAKIVANRLDLLNGLETLLFDKENKRKLLERDQLHKILEKEAWLFSEEFALAGSEERLEEVLIKHLDKLGKREDDPAPVAVGEGKTGRVDLLFHKVVQPRSGEYDYLVVELKRPSKKIDDEVLTQVKKYAVAVATDERFHDVPTRWTFIAISNDLNDFAKSEANQRNRPKGMVLDNAELNITVWARTWADVINNARSRLRFVNEQLAYEADRDSAKEYLRKAHAKFIPETMAGGESEAAGEASADMPPIEVLPYSEVQIRCLESN